MKTYSHKTIQYTHAMKTKIFVILLAVLASCSNGTETYDASGTFEAVEVLVASEASGKIVQLEVNEGQEVKAGVTLALIDTVQLSLKKQQLLTSVKAMQARRPEIQKQLAGTFQQIETAKREQKRVENLLKSNAANQKQLDDLTAQIGLLEKQLTAQKSTLNSTDLGIAEEMAALQIQVAQLDDQLLKCSVSSPIDGTVLAKYAELGEIANFGRALFKVADVNNMYLRAYVPSQELTKLKLGESVQVFADFGETTREYPGTISWISEKAEFTPKTIQTKDERANLVYAVKIAVKNDGYLKIGMYGGLKLNLNK